jgi:hypothetical protein
MPPKKKSQFSKTDIIPDHDVGFDCPQTQSLLPDDEEEGLESGEDDEVEEEDEDEEEVVNEEETGYETTDDEVSIVSSVSAVVIGIMRNSQIPVSRPRSRAIEARKSHQAEDNSQEECQEG